MKEIDALGKRCPLPIIDLAREMKELPEEDDFLLHSDDPATMSDLSAWARLTGHSVVQVAETSFSIARSN